jgi:hypothetical protein
MQQSRLGLQQPSTTTSGSTSVRKRAPPKSAPERGGPICWATVKVLSEHATSPQLECVNCGAKFCGEATRVRDHTTGGGALTACPCETDTFLDLKQKLMEVAGEKEDAAVDPNNRVCRRAPPLELTRRSPSSSTAATWLPPAIVGHPLFNKLVSVVKTAARRARQVTGYRCRRDREGGREGEREERKGRDPTHCTVHRCTIRTSY